MTRPHIESLERRQLLSTQGVAQLEPGIDLPASQLDERAIAQAKPGGGGGSSANPAIAFVTGNGDLKVMNADGSNQKSIWRGSGSSQPRSPTWHPDGQHIFFYSQVQGHGLYRIGLDGVGLTKVISLTRAVTSQISPVPGPNGMHRIVFDDQDASGKLSLFVADEDGGRRTQLTSGIDRFPTWSPDGQQIAYVHLTSDTNPRGLRMMKLGEDAAGNVNVADDVLLIPYGEEFQGVSLGFTYHNAFSQTEQKIYFHAPLFASEPPYNYDDIWSWDVGASQLRQITFTPNVHEYGSVSGSADDSRIVYEIGGTLYAANSDGSGRIALPKAKGERSVPYVDPSFKRAPVAARAPSSANDADQRRTPFTAAPRYWGTPGTVTRQVQVDDEARELFLDELK